MFPFDLNLSGKQKLKLLHKSFSVLSSERGCMREASGTEWCPAGHVYPDGYSVLIVRKYFIPVILQLRRTQIHSIFYPDRLRVAFVYCTNGDCASFKMNGCEWGIIAFHAF